MSQVNICMEYNPLSLKLIFWKIFLNLKISYDDKKPKIALVAIHK